MVMDQQDVEKMVRDLSQAIEKGNVENAKDIAGKLAEKNAVIDMIYEPPDNSRDKIISIKILIENKEKSSRRPLEWDVKVSTKIAQLKRLLHREKGVPESYQRWIVNKRIAEDTASLSSCGVTEDGYTVFVYIMSRKPRTVHPGLDGEHTFDISGMGAGDGGSGPATLPAQPTVRPGSEATTTPRRELPFATMPPMGVTEGGAGSMDVGVSSMDTATGVEEHQIQIGWNCTSCTYLNQPQDRSCHICSNPRPANYEVPPEYRSVPESRPRSRSPSPHDTYQSQRPSHHPQRPHESHQPQRPHESHPPQHAYDHHQSQRPHESHQPQRPHESHLLHGPQRDTHLPQRPTENSTTATLASSADERRMVYNYNTMTYEYQDQPPNHS